MERMDSLTGPSAFQVTMDGQPVDLPDWLGESLDAIKTYLECIAMKEERVLWTLQVDGIKLDLAEPDLLIDAFNSVRANTISYDELAERLVTAGRTKVHELLTELEPAVLNVLINDTAFAERLWYDWEPQLREPLFSLRALSELKRTNRTAPFDSALLPTYLDQLGFTCSEVESLFVRNQFDENSADLVSLSEILDFTLIPWLRNLDALFQRLHEKFRLERA